MAKGPKYEFKITPGGLNARANTGGIKDRNPAAQRPTDANQRAPTEACPVRNRNQLAGGN